MHATLVWSPFGGERRAVVTCTMLGRLLAMCYAVQTGYAASPIKLLARDDPLYAWRQRMLKAYDNPHTAHGQKGFPESLE